MSNSQNWRQPKVTDLLNHLEAELCFSLYFLYTVLNFLALQQPFFFEQLKDSFGQDHVVVGHRLD
jgi:hypothetical protein